MNLSNSPVCDCQLSCLEKFHKRNCHYIYIIVFGCGAGACLNRVLLDMEAGVGDLSIWLGVH